MIANRLPGQITWEIGYVGNASRDLEADGFRNINLVPFGAMFADASPADADPNKYRPYAAYGQINTIRHNLYQDYHSLQTTVSRQVGRANISDRVYPDLDEFVEDTAAAYRAEIADLYAAGCRYLQLDDVSLAYLCDERMREEGRARGEDPDAVLARSVALVRATLRDRPSDLAVCTHLCRGNFRSSWRAQGGYERVAETIFTQMPYDGFFLEFDDARSGDFSPLRHVPRHVRVVLGLVSTKVGALESTDALRRRIDEAARFVPLEQLCVSPQCGFSSTAEGNELTPDEQRAKLAFCVEIARQVWGGL